MGTQDPTSAQGLTTNINESSPEVDDGTLWSLDAVATLSPSLRATEHVRGNIERVGSQQAVETSGQLGQFRTNRPSSGRLRPTYRATRDVRVLHPKPVVAAKQPHLTWKKTCPTKGQDILAKTCEQRFLQQRLSQIDEVSTL